MLRRCRLCFGWPTNQVGIGQLSVLLGFASSSVDNTTHKFPLLKPIPCVWIIPFGNFHSGLYNEGSTIRQDARKPQHKWGQDGDSLEDRYKFMRFKKKSLRDLVNVACKSAVNVLEEKRSKRQLGKFEDRTLMVGEKRVAAPNLRHRQLCGLQKTQRTSGQMEKEELMSKERMINNVGKRWKLQKTMVDSRKTE